MAAMPGLPAALLGLLIGGAAAVWPPAAFAEDTDCKPAGIDVYQYTSVVPLSDGTSLPVLITQPADSITHVVVAQHGASGAANTYFCQSLNLATMSKALQTTMVVAPWFPTEDVSYSQWLNNQSAKGTVAQWATAGWCDGSNSQAPVRGRGNDGGVSSFVAIDTLLEWLQNLLQHPLTVTLTGFSAGAQLLLRWAVFSPMGANGRLPVTAQGAPEVNLQVIVGDPSSYMYLASQRPSRECTPLMDTGPDHACVTYEDPWRTCEDRYDQYKYGLGDLALASKRVSYLASFAANPALVKAAVTRFATKDIRFLFGIHDICNCNTEGYTNNRSACYPDPGRIDCKADLYGGEGCCDTYPDTATDNALDVMCEAMLQGSNRLQRGLNYMGHLRKHLNGGEYNPTFARFNGGHNSLAFLSSPWILSWAMGQASGDAAARSKAVGYV